MTVLIKIPIQIKTITMTDSITITITMMMTCKYDGFVQYKKQNQINNDQSIHIFHFLFNLYIYLSNY